MIIYKATNKVDGKVYIGLTVNSLKQRKSQHLSEASLGKSKTPFHQALRENPDAFEWEIAERCETWDQLTERETFWVEKYKADDPKYGYNTHNKRFVSRYKRVVPRESTKLYLDKEMFLAVKLLSIELGIECNELIEEGMKMVLRKYEGKRINNTK